MESYLDLKPYDLVSPDGAITHLTRIDDRTADAVVFIEKISPAFVGFTIPVDRIFFNVKSTLPLILRACGIDPAASSAPFVATIVDVTGVVIYFLTALFILKGTML